MTWDRRLTSSLKEGLLRVFVALKNAIVSAWFQHAKPESNGEHDNH
jgi:hypothetical protein